MAKKRVKREETNVPIAEELLHHRKYRLTEQETHIRVRALEIVVRVVDALSRGGLRGRHLPAAAGAHVVLGIEKGKGQEGVTQGRAGGGEEEIEVADCEIFRNVTGTVAAPEGSERGWEGKS